jgi:phosphoesterase RecJ-like protein
MSFELETQFREMNALFAEADRIFLVSHENPDPDAVGSVLALSALFERQGKVVFSYLPTPPPSALRFLPGFQKISTKLPQDCGFDVAVCLDYGDFSRLRLSPQLAVPTFVTIDHHPKSTQQGNIMVIVPEYSSTCEILYWWLKWTGIPIDREIATCLLCGIIADTGGFLHSATSHRTFRAVSGLLLCNASLPKIVQGLSAPHHESSFVQLLGRILSNIRIDEKTELAYSWIGHDELSRCEIGNFSLQDIPSLIASASPVHLGALLIEEGQGFVRGSLRAESWSQCDVSLVARALGGGGHRYAAGFRYQGSLEEALQKIRKLIE